MKRKRDKPKPEIDKQNAEAAAIILEDPERHGGEGSLAVQWARLWMQNHNVTEVMKWKPPAPPRLEDLMREREEELREKRTKDIERMRARWRKRHWRRSANGNPVTEVKTGFRIVLFFKRGFWQVMITDTLTGDKRCFDHPDVPDEEDAKLEAFSDYLIMWSRRSSRHPALVEKVKFSVV